MRILIFVVTSLLGGFGFADVKIKMSFKNEDVLNVIETYAKATGQKFVVDPGVRGKISIFLPGAVSAEEAFNQLSSALAVNGFAISRQGDTMIVKAARNIQRDFMEVTTERPALKPERMCGWVYTVKNLPAEFIVREIRVLVSSSGEVNLNSHGNQLIFTDWSSNLNRVADLLKEIDKPVDSAVSKFAEPAKK